MRFCQDRILKGEGKVSAQLKLRSKIFEVNSGMTIRDALIKIGVAPESVLPTRHGELLTEDEKLQEGDQIRLVAVISGGSLSQAWD
jgi:sulfur carrier protein ThiS